jgi:hypothetical protein
MKQNKGNVADTADTAALAVDGSQPVWMTLNEARERAFTGEIVFETDPEVLAYLDHGIVYYAERVTDASLGRRLLDAGVIDVEQLDRGIVRVGDIEHLGRLFDRDPSVDRDAVIVVAETATEELIADLANRAVTTVRVTAYRHHPSGVHRWFVAPLDPAAQPRPVSTVAQLDSTVVDDLPSLPFGTDELVIEWDEIDPVDDADQMPADGFELSLDLAEFIDTEPGDTEAADLLAFDHLVDVEAGDAAESDLVNELALTETADDFEFSVVWPDGSEEPAVEIGEYNGFAPSTTDSDPVQDTVVIETEGGDLEFTMPPLVVGDSAELADAEVPDDVAEAVRRAIAAIETVSVASPQATMDEPSMAVADVAAVVDVTDVADVDVDVPADVLPTVADAPSPSMGFAPPTMAMRAEVLYGLVDDDAASTDATAQAATIAGSAPAPGVASVVFVDEPAEESSGGGNERSSALRRLIGSLRRKDH